MTTAVAERLAALREHMARHDLHVYLVPAADEHQNEFLAAHKLRREAISGFSGSAGDVAVTREGAHLFVDSRYHLQAEQQTDPGVYTVHKLGQAGVAELPGWLRQHQAEHGPLRVGFDPFQVTLLSARRLRAVLQQEGSALVAVQPNLVDAVWRDRPAPGRSAVYALPLKLTGRAVADKLAAVREAMAAQGADVLVLTRLDEVAWVTNLRGSDIPHNPVFEAYLLVGPKTATCFTDSPVPQDVAATCEGAVRFRPYGDFTEALQAAAGAGGEAAPRVWLDPAGTTEGTRLLLGEDARVMERPNPVVHLKAVKNEVEVRVIREGHVKAAAAKVRAFATLESRLAEGRAVSEADFADLLAAEYAREEGYADLSFTTICGFGENGAIVHYGTPDPEKRLTPGGLLLVDSGIQVAGATTDDTRTIAIGAPDETQRRRFTDVLRGHIRLALQTFPEGTNGIALDALARAPLWNEGLDYGHGTGHGVGAFLNVHEGPHNISPRGTTSLEPGMVVSNEPGYYQSGWGGIRCENLYVVVEAHELPPHPAGRRWLRLSPLTLIPFDPHLIVWERLAPDEQAWLSAYHEQVRETLAPRLDEPARHWLERACILPA